jgi:hypothetical protein
LQRRVLSAPFGKHMLDPYQRDHDGLLRRIC